MAGIDQIPANLTEEERVAFERFKKVADEKAASEGGSNDGTSAIHGFIFNNHKVENTKLRKIYSNHWSGESTELKPVPKTVGWNSYEDGYFVHVGPLPDCPIAGFVYADGDKEDTTARKWLFAFEREKAKVCVDAGPMGPMDWNGVKYKLDHLSGHEAIYVDPVHKGVAKAYYYKNYFYVFFSN